MSNKSKIVLDTNISKIKYQHILEHDKEQEEKMARILEEAMKDSPLIILHRDGTHEIITDII